MIVDQTSAEATHILQGDAKALDAWLKSLWDRVKKAGELISRLREEKAGLQVRVASLEEEVSRLKNELAKNEDLVRSFSAERTEGNRPLLSNGERELLSARVKDLMAKLDAYI
jgi:predicted  nucleic acid-binding Zn-ribbon protein